MLRPTVAGHPIAADVGAFGRKLPLDADEIGPREDPDRPGAGHLPVIFGRVHLRRYLLELGTRADEDESQRATLLDRSST